MSSKLDLLISWVMLLVVSLEGTALWLKIISFTIAILVGTSASIKFYWDWKDRKEEKTKK
ncbi:MAG: hypothetical protein GDA51_10260 [Ekhidna sp.]|nr:hypothetical protein [Ekhidna sp.]MBC6409951.1 hypothetical protein [Ekhidna sp.]MBC6426829.1 hypothetical protein [Ekhidna sp.]